MSTFKAPSNPSNPSPLSKLKLNTRLDTLKALDMSGPLSATTPQSAFLSSPIIGSTLLLNARKLAVISPVLEEDLKKPKLGTLEEASDEEGETKSSELEIVAGLGKDGGVLGALDEATSKLKVPGDQYSSDSGTPLSPGGLGRTENIGKDPVVLHPVEVPVTLNYDSLKRLFGKFMGWRQEAVAVEEQSLDSMVEKISEVSLNKEEAKFEEEHMSEIEIFSGQIKPVAISTFQDLLFLMRITKWKIAYSKGEVFNREEQLPYFGRFDRELVDQTLKSLITEIWPPSGPKNRLPKEAHRALALSKMVVDPDTPLPELLGALQKSYELTLKAIERFGAQGQFGYFGEGLDDEESETVKKELKEEDKDEKLVKKRKEEFEKSFFKLKLTTNPERLIISYPTHLAGVPSDNSPVNSLAAKRNQLLSAISTVAAMLRSSEKDPSFVDYLLFHIGYELLKSGAKLDSSDARWLGTVGFRKDCQTYVSLTDPGEGHVWGTTRKEKWVRGAIVHVEHLERPGNLKREEIESYRIPSIFEFARVRLHTGSSAPNTYFVGRRVKDSTSGNFSHDFIKVVNLTSAACSAAFQLGAAETKVAMDGLTSSEAVAYMRALAGHVIRNHKQVLSAAFNLNAPFVDDLSDEKDENGNPKVITEQMDIGRRGIELASMGGFDKVTFDGAADTYPSYCVILQLTFQNALELVHKAHSAGLLTYFSAGFKFAHIGDAVLSGVDGIGIGGAQILRYMDHDTGHHGPYTEEFIDEIDKQRDTAANSLRGQGVLLLCRMDRMYVEGSLSSAEEALREPLYRALHETDELKIRGVLAHEELQSIKNLPHDGESPTIGTARRLLREGIIPKLSIEGTTDSKEWERFAKDLKGVVNQIGNGKEEQEVEEILAQYFSSQPWAKFRENYRKSKPELREDRYFTIKATPLS